VTGTVQDVALLFALIAGVAMAVYTIFMRLAASDVHPALGATVVTGVAFAVNLAIVLVLRASGTAMSVSLPTMALLAVVGAAAASADFFTLSAYGSGLKATSSFVIAGTTTVLVLVVGFLVLREPFSWTKLAAIALITGGIFLLHREGV
jgi:drug/metabolite transporter (DMT)-like permease